MKLKFIIKLGGNMNIELETLCLTRYNEQEHSSFVENFEKGNSSSEYIHKIGDRLRLSKDNNKSIYNSAFVVEEESTPIGYLFISSMVHDEVSLECSLLKEIRGKGYGSRILNEVVDYLFKECNIKSVRLDIDPSNKNSFFSAIACGFECDEEEFALRNYTGRMQFVKESDCYVSKRRK